MNNIDTLKFKIEQYLDSGIDKEKYPICWSMIQIEPEKYRLMKTIVYYITDQNMTDIEAILGLIENSFNVE
jgi:hypothetical protein